MNLQVLSVLTAASLLGFISCNNDNPKTETTTLSWRFPILRGTTKEKVGRQMPPHPEPDAVLINAGQNGQPRMPGGFPGGPPVYGAPRDPNMFGFPSLGGGPGVFGIPQGPNRPVIPQGPGIFGIPQSPDVPGIPQGPGVFTIPQGPGVFGIPQGPDVSGIPQGPTVFGIPQVPDVPAIPPGVFVTPGFPDTFPITGFHIIPRKLAKPSAYGPPRIPNGPGMIMTRLPPAFSDPPAAQTKPGFILRTRIFTIPGGPLQPGDMEMFGQRGVFAIAGSGNVPFPGAPTFFYPGRGSNTPGRFPETFVPNSDGAFPGIFYPEAPTFPYPTRDTSNGNFPGWEGAEGREINDEPMADPFPLIDAPTYSQSS